MSWGERKGERVQGWVAPDAIGPGQKHDEMGRVVPDFAPGFAVNAENQMDFGDDHPVIAALLARIAALEKAAGI